MKRVLVLQDDPSPIDHEIGLSNETIEAWWTPLGLTVGPGPRPADVHFHLLSYAFPRDNKWPAVLAFFGKNFTWFELSGESMKRIASFVLAIAVAAVAFSVSAYAQQARGTAGQQSGTAAPADFNEGSLKFHRASTGFMQVVDTTKNQNAGTVIFPPGGAPVFAPMPGYDIKSAFEKHMNGGEASAAPQAAPPNKEDVASAAHAPTSAVPATAFDEASKTVTLTDGRVVTFVDNDNLKVQMPGASGTKIYELHFHKASVGGLMKGWAGREQGRVGGSAGGGGVTITLQSQNGMPGGEVYDTAKGTVYGSSGFVQAKSVTAAVREAANVVKTSGQPDLAKLNVVKSLLNNNLGI